MTTPIPVDRKNVTDALDEIIRRKDGLDLALGVLPSLFGTSEKATYLGFRAVGLGHKDSLIVGEWSQQRYDTWCEEFPEFESYCNERIHELQAHHSAEVVRLQFMRNMSLFLLLDHRMLRMAHTDFNSMSESQAAYLRTARRHYTPKMMHELDIALEPDKHRSQTIVLQFGNNTPMYEVIEGEAEVIGQRQLSEPMPQDAAKDKDRGVLGG